MIFNFTNIFYFQGTNIIWNWSGDFKGSTRVNRFSNECNICKLRSTCHEPNTQKRPNAALLCYGCCQIYAWASGTLHCWNNNSFAKVILFIIQQSSSIVKSSNLGKLLSFHSRGTFFGQITSAIRSETIIYLCANKNCVMKIAFLFLLQNKSRSIYFRGSI